MRRKEEIAAAPEMPGQSNGEDRHAMPKSTLASPEEVDAKLTELERRQAERSNAGGKRKGPRKPRSPARTVVYVEKLFKPFTLEQRKAMYAMLASVTEADDEDHR